jgi:hypothetical protein
MQEKMQLICNNKILQKTGKYDIIPSLTVVKRKKLINPNKMVVYELYLCFKNA